MQKRVFIAFVLFAVFSVFIHAQNDNTNKGGFFLSGGYYKIFVSSDEPLQILSDLRINDLNIAKIGANYELPLGPGNFAFGLEAGYCSGSMFGGKGDVDFYPLNITTSYVFPLAKAFFVGPSLKLGGLVMISPEWTKFELMTGARLEAELRSEYFPLGLFVAGGIDFFPNAYETRILPAVEAGLRFPRGSFFANKNESGKEEGKLKASTDLELQITTIPEAKLILSQTLGFPFLHGSGPLTKDNNISTVLSAEITPVTLLGKGEINITPAAFFVLSGGASAGSGWNIPISNGMGFNKPINENAARPREAAIVGDDFDGLVWNAWGAATLQFDLGALVPGDWTHVLFQTRQEFRHSAFTKADSGEPWVFEGDEGQNMNGWKYCASYVLGYSMPRSPVLDTIAFMAEMEKTLYGIDGGDFWGENLGKWTFSGLLHFTITPRLNTTLALQMRTRRNYGTSDFENKDYFYQDFELSDEGGQRRILFYRAALLLNYKIK